MHQTIESSLPNLGTFAALGTPLICHSSSSCFNSQRVDDNSVPVYRSLGTELKTILKGSISKTVSTVPHADFLRLLLGSAKTKCIFCTFLLPDAAHQRWTRRLSVARMTGAISPIPLAVAVLLKPSPVFRKPKAA